jgi:polyhydroxybutyrate depolymerase
MPVAFAITRVWRLRQFRSIPPVQPPMRIARHSLNLLLMGCTPSAVVSSLLPDNERRVDAAAEIDAVGATELSVGTEQRKAVVALPPGDTRKQRRPLLVLLHGYALPPAYLDEYLGLRELARARGMYLLLPESKTDAVGLTYWNATDACCDFDGTNVDDVAALSDVIQATRAALPVDETRIYLIGHSNGGFMAYRMACERGARIAGIAVVAGASFLDPAACAPGMPVSVLHIHGDADSVISYAGGSVPAILGKLAPFPGALASVQQSARRADCNPTPVPGEALDLTPMNAKNEAAETEVLKFLGCDPGVDVTLWTVRGAGHEPAFHEGAFDTALAWLAAHQR